MNFETRRVNHDSPRVVIALGGNAIKLAHQEGTYKEQYEAVKSVCNNIIELMRRGFYIVITHGNGPQIGNLLIQQESGLDKIPIQPMDSCGAMTQGQIGYMIQQCLYNCIRNENLNVNVVTLISQVLVDKDDPAFFNLTKPVGPFYAEEQVKRLSKGKKYVIKKVTPNGGMPYRRVVPSPEPVSIVEKETIRKLVDEGTVVVACGGGGIPVIKDDNGNIIGMEAVIDKDLGAEKLGETIGANILMILTDISNVYLNFGTKDQKALFTMKIDDAKRYLGEGHFLHGTMKPKVEACIKFLEFGGEKAIIASLSDVVTALEGRAGTQIIH